MWVPKQQRKDSKKKKKKKAWIQTILTAGFDGGADQRVPVDPGEEIQALVPVPRSSSGGKSPPPSEMLRSAGRIPPAGMRFLRYPIHHLSSSCLRPQSLWYRRLTEINMRRIFSYYYFLAFCSDLNEMKEPGEREGIKWSGERFGSSGLLTVTAPFAVCLYGNFMISRVEHGFI